jgi:hypothetical protein
MSAYVRNFRAMPRQDPLAGTLEFEIYFSDRPEWRLGTLELAQADCRYLNSTQTHVGSHYCHFEVEELEPGVFGVVYRTHPALREETL